MAYKGIRLVALMSVLMAVAWLAVLGWATFWSGTEGAPVSIKAVRQALTFVLVLLATLATYVSQILERQADQISVLERDVAELRSANPASRRAG